MPARSYIYEDSSRSDFPLATRKTDSGVVRMLGVPYCAIPKDSDMPPRGTDVSIDFLSCRARNEMLLAGREFSPRQNISEEAGWSAEP